MNDILLDRFEQLTQTLATQGWCVVPDFIDADSVRALAAESEAYWLENKFREARIGVGRTLQANRDLRGDYILWLDEAAPTAAQQAYVAQLELLRAAINRILYLGIFDFELHLTRYPAGTRYCKHLDRHANTQTRAVSCILYLNEQWCEADGGHLRLFLSHDKNAQTLDILPQGGTLVLFLSGDYYHEVLPARRSRLSISGWMRTRV